MTHRLPLVVHGKVGPYAQSQLVKTGENTKHAYANVLPWTKKKKKKKKRTIPEIGGEKNAVPSCDVTRLVHARSAQGKSEGWPCPALIAHDQAYHKIEQCSSRCESC